MKFKVYRNAESIVKSQFASGGLREFDTTKYSKAFSCLPLEKTSNNKKIFMGFEWETGIEGDIYKARGVTGWGKGIKKSFCDTVLRKALSTPTAAYLNYRHEGPYLLELVSIPATLGYHKKVLMKQFFANKLHHKFEQTSACGFHVHIDNATLDEKTVLNMIWFLSNPDNAAFINWIAGRDIGDTHWCSPYPVKPKYRNGKVRSIGFLVRREGNYFKTLRKDPYAKHICLNTNTGLGTCELRIFAAPSTYEGLVKNLEFTEALVKFCKDRTLNDTSIKNFLLFVEKNKRRYYHLNKFLMV